MNQKIRFSVRDGAVHADGVFIGTGVAVSIPSDIGKRVARLAEAAFADADGKLPDRSKVDPADLPCYALPGLIAVLRAPTGPYYSSEVFVLIPPLDEEIAALKAERDRVKAEIEAGVTAVESAARYVESMKAGIAGDGIVEG